MRRANRCVWVTILLTSRVLSAQSLRPAPPVGVAVLPIDVARPESAASGVALALATAIAREIANRPSVIFAERSPSYLDRLNADTNLRRSFVPARYLVTGTAFSADAGRTRVALEALDSETGDTVVFYETALGLNGTGLAARHFVDRLTGWIGSHQASDKKAPMRRQIPTEALAAYSRGLLYRDRGHIEQAAAMFEEALRIYPAYGEVCVQLRRLRPSARCGVGGPPN
jgi:hypothetical protein